MAGQALQERWFSDSSTFRPVVGWLMVFPQPSGGEVRRRSSSTSARSKIDPVAFGKTDPD